MQAGLRKRYKHFKRYREVANVLVRHGFGYILHQLDLIQFLGHGKRKSEKEKTIPLTKRAERIRMVLEELGPTFIKLGQLLSTRSDLLAPEYINELGKLQDNVPPFSFSEVKESIQMELGQPLEIIFQSFDVDPLAAASIGQVHRAVLKSNQEVVVKIKRPRIEKILSTDIEILYDLARLMDRHAPFRGVYNLSEMVEEFEKMVMEEIDFIKEGRNADIFRKNFHNDPTVYIPEVYWDYTTRSVLIMEYVEGVKLANPDEIARHDIDVREIARILNDSLLRQILIYGFFHADPHPGNLAALPRNRLMFMDFGIVGKLSENLKEKIGDLVLGLVNRSTPQVARAISKMGVLPSGIDRNALYQDVDKMREKYYDVPFKELKLSDSLSDVLQIAFRHRIKVPSEITMLVKALVIAEGVSRQLDPELSAAEIARPLSRRLLVHRFSLQGLIKTVAKCLTDYHHLLITLPGHLEQILEIVSSGQLKVKTQNIGLDQLISKLNSAINRLILGILLGSLIIGSSLLVGQGYTVFWGVSIAELLFTISGILGLLLIFSIFRSRKL